MEKVTVLYEGKKIEVQKGLALSSFLALPQKPCYNDDPIVGALINGEYKNELSPSSRRAWVEIAGPCHSLPRREVALLAEGVGRNHTEGF